MEGCRLKSLSLKGVYEFSKPLLQTVAFLIGFGLCLNVLSIPSFVIYDLVDRFKPHALFFMFFLPVFCFLSVPIYGKTISKIKVSNKPILYFVFRFIFIMVFIWIVFFVEFLIGKEGYNYLFRPALLTSATFSFFICIGFIGMRFLLKNFSGDVGNFRARVFKWWVVFSLFLFLLNVLWFSYVKTNSKCFYAKNVYEKVFTAKERINGWVGIIFPALSIHIRDARTVCVCSFNPCQIGCALSCDIR